MYACLLYTSEWRPIATKANENFPLALGHVGVTKTPNARHRLCIEPVSYTHLNRSINVDFGVEADVDDNTDYRIISVDVVPAFDKDGDYEIPDADLAKWIETNPQTHAAKATAAHQAYSCLLYTSRRPC